MEKDIITLGQQRKNIEKERESKIEKTIRNYFLKSIGEEKGISDEYILEKLFGKKKFIKQEINLIKKLRYKIQRELFLVGKKNTSGEFIRYRISSVSESDEYILSAVSNGISRIKRAGVMQRNHYEFLNISYNVENFFNLIEQKNMDIKEYLLKDEEDEDERNRDNQ